MSLWRSLPLLNLAGLSLLVSAALWPRSAPPTAPPPVYPVRPEPAAGQALDRAIAALDPLQMPWLRTTLWQQVNLAPLSFEAEGTYCAGPDHRLRLDLTVRFPGGARGLQLVSDGHTVWEADQGGPEEGRVGKVDLPRLLPVLQHPNSPAEAREEFYRTQLFAGPSLLLLGLRQNVIFTRKEKVRWRDRDVIVLSGARRPGANPAEAWPDYRPRQCRLVVDGETFWPHRVEWWGPMPGCTGDIRLIQIEFRETAVGQPIPDRFFTFLPGRRAVDDHTAQWTQRLQPSVADGDETPPR